MPCHFEKHMLYFFSSFFKYFNTPPPPYPVWDARNSYFIVHAEKIQTGCMAVQFIRDIYFNNVSNLGTQLMQ